jgi:hypothetical protein
MEFDELSSLLRKPFLLLVFKLASWFQAFYRRGRKDR